MTRAARDLAVVHAQNTSLVVAHTIVLDALVAERGLVLTQSDAGDVAAVVLRGERAEGAPAAADIEQTVLGLQVELRAHKGKLVVLQFLERLRARDVLDNTRGVDHARAQEPIVLARFIGRVGKDKLVRTRSEMDGGNGSTIRRSHRRLRCVERKKVNLERYGRGRGHVRS